MPRRLKAFSNGANRHKRVASDTKEPAVNPRSIELALLLWMSKWDRSECEETRNRFSALESTILKHEAMPSLQALLSAGCERGTLLCSLGLSCGRPVEFIFDGWFTEPGPHSLQNLFGLKGREFSKLRDLILEAAQHVDGINRRFEFGVLLTTPHLQMFQGIPRLLQGYVSLLDLAAERLAGGTHFYRNMGKGILTLYVKQQTGRFQDQEVSGLLAAVGNNSYDAVNHRDWRKEHKELLDRLSVFIPLFHSSPQR
jgi:hypothetical protein